MPGFWSRVTVQATSDTQTGTGNVRPSWYDYHPDLEARVLPVTVDERLQTWATPEDTAVEVHLRYAWPDITPHMRVLIGTDAYDIRHISLPPGSPYALPGFVPPSTVLSCVRITP